MIAATSSAISSISPISNSFISSRSSLSSSPSSNGKNSKVLFSNLPLASRIFVKNLSYTTGEASLIKLFAKFGPIVEVKLAKHDESKKSKGYAFIQYTCQDDAILAIEHMDENIIDGRIVHAEIAKPSTSGFGAYPKSLGPPPLQNLGANSVSDHVGGDRSSSVGQDCKV